MADTHNLPRVLCSTNVFSIPSMPDNRSFNLLNKKFPLSTQYSPTDILSLSPKNSLLFTAVQKKTDSHYIWRRGSRRCRARITAATRWRWRILEVLRGEPRLFFLSASLCSIRLISRQ